MEKKNVLLSVKDLEVKFRVRGRILSAIRGVSLDIYEDESIAIVGESGAGKSVFTKAFAGMLDSNGFVSNGSIIFNDPELSDTVVKLNSTAWKFINSYKKQLDENSRLELGSATYRKMLELFIGKPLQGNLLRPEFEEMATTELTRPELALFDARKKTLSAREALIKSSTRPKFGFFAQGYYGYPSMDYFACMMSNEWRWNLLTGIRMSWNFGAYYTKKNSLNKLRTAQQSIDLQRDVFRFETNLQVAQETGDIARLRKTIADDARIVSLRQSVREAAESKLRNGIIDTNDLLQKITDEAAARSAQSVHEIELLKALYELKHTINQ